MCLFGDIVRVALHQSKTFMTPMLREAVLLDPVHYKSNPGSCQHVPAPILAMASCCGLNQCCSKVLHRNKYITFAEFCVLSL